MKNGEMKTLREWIEELKISPVKYTFPSTGCTLETYKSEVKKDRNGYIDIFTKGGYGLRHKDVEKYLKKSAVFLFLSILHHPLPYLI